MRLFNFGRNNRLSLATVVDEHDYELVVGRWLSGRVLGRYVSVVIPWRSRRKAQGQALVMLDGQPFGVVPPESETAKMLDRMKQDIERQLAERKGRAAD